MRKITRIERLTTFFGARNWKLMHRSLVLSLAVLFALPPTHAQTDQLSGKDLVETVCAECHATGVDGAPKIGDVEAWSNRASQGLSGLTLHALEGIRNMPAHGGRPDLSDLAISRAVTYMVNRSGGNWVEPTSFEGLSKEQNGALIVAAQCVKCHGEGLNGAPKVGDREAWGQRIAKNAGFENLVHSAIRGYGGMPPRGDQANLTDNEIRSAILYMYYPAGAAAKPILEIARPVGAGPFPSRWSGGGMDIYLGIIPAKYLLQLPKGSPERTMHGGVPRGAGHYHVNVTLFHEMTRAPIDNAKIEIQLEHGGLTVAELEPMLSAAGSYGNYIEPQPETPYRITIRIARPGLTRDVGAIFEHRFE